MNCAKVAECLHLTFGVSAMLDQTRVWVYQKQGYFPLTLTTTQDFTII